MIKSTRIFYKLILGLLVLGSCRSPKQSLVPVKGQEPKPFDYWALVRSHPIHGFDKQSYIQGLDQINAIKQEQQLQRGPEHELDWRLEGPVNIGGKVDVITPIHRGSDTIFAGTANGGIYRSLDGGQNWNPVFENYGSMCIGSITVDPTNEQIIYAGTGDRNFSGTSFLGNGLYRSTDMGLTWTNIGLTQVGIITSCSVNPQNPQEIIVGALGDPFQKTNDRGIYRSSDGGLNWTNTLFVSDSSGVVELLRNPMDPQILYASSFNRMNLPDHGISSGPDAAVFKSIDGGQTWTRLTNGLPQSAQSRVGIALSESNPNKLLALFIGTDYLIQDLYVSLDAGASWNGLFANGGMIGMDPGSLGTYGWYFGRVHINPFDENHFILPGIDQYASYDGGQNWALNVPEWWNETVHADKHELVFQDANTILIGTDGGIYKTDDGAVTWQALGNLPITQYYDITAKTFSPGIYAGGAQDNGTTSGNYQNMTWNKEFGGDGFKVSYLSSSDHSVIYETQYAGLSWMDDINGYNEINPFESNTNWFTPYQYLPGNNLVLLGSNRLLKMNGPPFGTWDPISGDLTEIGMGTTTSPDYFHTISELEVHPDDENQILVGTSDGLVWLSDLNGMVQNITANLPDHYLTGLLFSKTQSQKLYCTMSGYYNNFSQALIFKSIDNGQSWQSISANLPAIGINDILSVKVGSSEYLFIATDGGVFVSINDGISWDLLGQNLPLATVSSIDIDVVNKRLVAGTFGRSVWSYDISHWLNQSSLEELSLSEQIYPNPASSSMILQSQANKLTLYNQEGKVLLEKENLSQGTSIDLAAIPSGIYLLEVDGKRGKLVIR